MLYNIDKQVLGTWLPYVESITDWEELVDGIESKSTSCGPVYELPNPIDRPNESFAIADMRNLPFAEPHYHKNGEVEIYIVLQGMGLSVVGRQEQKMTKGSVIITPPDTTHFTIPDKDLVLAVVNTPPFNPDNAVSISQTDHSLGFDKEQFDKLTANREAL